MFSRVRAIVGILAGLWNAIFRADVINAAPIFVVIAALSKLRVTLRCLDDSAQKMIYVLKSFSEHHMAFKWTCPYCNLVQAVTDGQRVIRFSSLEIDRQAEGMLGILATAIGCSNPSCLRTTIHVKLGNAHRPHKSHQTYVELISEADPLVAMYLMPQGNAKPQPDYLPKAIREDYYEACLIQDLSPKASATLTRRCLQGMIRDFAGIVKARLIDEIDALRKAVEDGSADRSVTLETVEAINHVRGIGNIGAHMEKDIDLIVPVDPGEALALIELVEMLFDEWYGARERRKSRLARIESIAGEKRALKSALEQQKVLPAPQHEKTDPAI
jgi:hypothetical protein